MALHYRWRLAIGLVAIFFAAGFQLAIPILIGNAVDTANNLFGDADARAKDALVLTAILLFAVSVGRGFSAMVQNYMGESIGQHIGYELRMLYYEKLQRLSFSYHAGVHTGDLITRGILDVEGVRMFVQTALLRSVFLVVLIGTGMYLMLTKDLQLGLISLSFVPFVAWRATVARLRLRSNWYSLQEKLSSLTKVMDENLGGIRVVRAFASQKHEMMKFDGASNEALSLANIQVGIRATNISLMSLAFMLAMAAVLWVGGLRVIDGEMTAGGLTQFLAFMSILLQPVRQIGMMVNGYARGAASGGRLFSVLDLEPDIQDKPGAKDLEITEGVLEFHNVSFGYEGEHTLNGVSFKVQPGHTVGIVGPPGSGKSTIAHLVPRFYDPVDGYITIDGQDLRDIKLESLRRAVGVVEQDTFLFTASVEHNVAYGDPWAPDDRVELASQYAQLGDYIERLPGGYDTMVGERGVSLSGGQRQRLSIARSIMLKPRLIVFDDSTAAIDAATEQRIRAALAELTKDRATIIISHRLSSLMHADEILFIDEGKIVERGTHDELLALGGHYNDLYELQIRPSEDSHPLDDEGGAS
ncbi:MAG: ABC transporter ATP-binding protein [Chloroflexi bacterium]|nr:ABC transporter ATP-binding protein [Chloroflexota bacterium]MCI0804635.1 ABC transporter ATP-binding protein [Chloroflexota bacterium]MCI0807752.1 ABC transporter ATP-binding protein [Chloroflexota bacterium]MCI0833577.1 ABC transporter ATP-binding protein [Chloroflexota bacterium]MCI0835803.1 ABC transporter ATP-binding protein [Chloroflexota bacterium]